MTKNEQQKPKPVELKPEPPKRKPVVKRHMVDFLGRTKKAGKNRK